MNRFFYFLLLSVILFPLHAQDEKIVKIVSRYEIFCNERTEKMMFRICLPQNIENRQDIGGISFSVTPERIYDEDGRKYAEFEILEPFKIKKIDMVVPVKIYRCDYNSLSKKNTHTPESDTVLKKFLINEKSIEKDNFHIQKKASELKAKNRLETVRNIYYYVNKNVTYKANGKDLGALYAYMNRQGDCSEFSHLFIALCRANGIPARYTVGYVTYLAANQCHAWPEVYFDNIGWVPFDPTINNAGSYKKMQNHYVYMYFMQADGEYTDFAYYNYRYWGEEPQVKWNITIQ